MKKRIVSLLLTLVMVLSLVPMSVFAADNHDGQVWKCQEMCSRETPKI